MKSCKGFRTRRSSTVDSSRRQSRVGSRIFKDKWIEINTVDDLRKLIELDIELQKDEP
ncbi:MAG: hypothetical protein K0R75_1866 [Paenibacillaceae bacterium]|nr:hypothetical protein [Paenibacillaceae bacterium]